MEHDCQAYFTSHNEQLERQAKKADDITLLDWQCHRLYNDLLRPYLQQLNTQPALTLSIFDGAFKQLLQLVRRHISAAHEDFYVRLKTNTIPYDAGNLTGCLAGSIIMCGFTSVPSTHLNEICKAFEHILVLLGIGQVYYIENKVKRQQVIFSVKKYLQSPDHAAVEERYLHEGLLSPWDLSGLSPRMSEASIEYTIFGKQLFDRDNVACDDRMARLQVMITIITPTRGDAKTSAKTSENLTGSCFHNCTISDLLTRPNALTNFRARVNTMGAGQLE